MEVDDNVCEMNDVPEKQSVDFKKPLLIGKVGKLPKKVNEITNSENKEEKLILQKKAEVEESKDDDTSNIEKGQAFPTLPYKIPSWSGIPQSAGKSYGMEVLKTGKIIENIDLMSKAVWVFGRLENCDISMAHPTVSRYHAVLQYKEVATEDRPSGFYLYDLNSTHGTFLNKNRIKPQVYVRVQVGHMISIGCSTRHYILNGPEEDAEEESDLSVTELKQLRDEKILQRQKELEEAAEKAKKEEEERKKKQEEAGIDWGMGDDADEETDLSVNPFAQTNNEELYLDDPKKALRGFMEREGFDLEYDCSEQGMGQFLCKVTLPLDDERGRPIIAEVIHKGKKKEAVVQCALEACRILDRYGVLRQANHESRKRKAKNWEENDYYDSDDDTYLDRTGTVEKKRENRMKAKLPQQAETYKSLVEKEKNMTDHIKTLEKQLAQSARANLKSATKKEEDSLDSYMKSLNPTSLDKDKVSKLKLELLKLKADHAQIIKMVNIARPADLPPLVAQYNNDASKPVIHDKKGLPLFGKRKKTKISLPEKPKQHSEEDMNPDDEEFEEEENINEITQENIDNTNVKDDENEQTILIKNIFEESVLKESKKLFDTAKEIIALENTLAPKQFCTLNADLLTQLSEVMKPGSSEKLKERCKNEILHIQSTIEQYNAYLKKLQLVNNGYSRLLSNVIKEIDEVQPPVVEEEKINVKNNMVEQDEATAEELLEEPEKKKRKNQRRIQQRSDKAESEKQKGYKEDASKEDYNMWMPPEGQSGDGRTSLNEKLGY